MFKIIYFRSVYAEIPVSISPLKDYDSMVEHILKEIKEKCSIDVEIRDSSLNIEESLYENYLKHNYLLLDNLQILFDLGINVSVTREVIKRKGKGSLSPSLLVFKDEKAILFIKGKPLLFGSDGIIQFLERVKEDCSFLNVLQTSEGKRKAPRKESDIISEFAEVLLKREGYSVYRNVKEIDIGERKITIFPDIDIIAIKNNEVLCFEAKATSEIKNLYTALGEAMYYLIVEGNRGFCDKVYILLPDEPNEEKAKLITSLTPIGIILANGEVILEAKQNPYLDENLKRDIIASGSLDKYKIRT